MKKTILLTIVLIITLLASASPAGAANWVIRVNGGGLAASGGVEFSITVSAEEDDEGGITGQMAYSRSDQSVADLSMQGTVACLGIFSEGNIAVVAGLAVPINDPGGQVEPGDWMVVEILEGGVGSGDRVRVRILSAADGPDSCDESSGIFPGEIYDGDFIIQDNSDGDLRYGEITSPTEGEDVSGFVVFKAVLYNDDTDSGVEWAVRKDDCENKPGIVLGNVRDRHDEFNWDGEFFSAQANTSTWEPGTYCFVFNPKEDGGEASVRVLRTFTVSEPEPDEFCEEQWKPPILLADHTVNVHATLPIKFWLSDCFGDPLKGDQEPELIVWLLDGQGGSRVDDFLVDLKRGTGGYQFLGLFRPDEPGFYEAVLYYDGGEFTKAFEVVEHGKDTAHPEGKLTGQDKDKPGKPESTPQDKGNKDKPHGKSRDDHPGKGKGLEKP